MTDHPRDDANVPELPPETPFAERIARPLRDSDQLDPTFEARVMSGVHAEVRGGGRPRRAAPGWWRRPGAVQLSPLGALALAAGIAAVAIVGDAGVRALVHRVPTAMPASTVAAAPRTDTVHLVRFVFLAPDAQSVSLVGDFNDWARDSTQLSPTATPGAWSASVVLPPGRHEYAFIVHTGAGDRWMADPFASMIHRDEFGTESSIVNVGRSPSTRS